MIRYHAIIFLFGLVLFSTGYNDLAYGNETAVTFGLTPVIVDTNISFQKNWKRYLSRKIGEPVKFILRRSYQEIMVMLKYGEIDIAWICGYPFVTNQSELQLVAVPLFNGIPYYQSYLIVPSHSRATTLEMLKGKTHSFSDVDSNSGHIVPRYWLAQMDTTPEDFFSKYIFTYSHENVIRSVAHGITDGGNVDGYVWEVINKTDPELRGKTKVIRRSDFYGFPPIVAMKTFPGEMVEKIRKVLLGMSGDPEGQKILAHLHLDGFSEEDKSIFEGIRIISRKIKPKRVHHLTTKN